MVFVFFKFREGCNRVLSADTINLVNLDEENASLLVIYKLYKT